MRPRLHRKALAIARTAALSLGLAACDRAPAPPPAPNPALKRTAPSPYDENQTFVFLDDAKTNADTQADLTTLVLTDPSGQPAPLSQWLGKKNILLVLTRGYAGAICPACSTQTSALIAQYSQIASRDAEVVLVFPIADIKDRVAYEELLKSAAQRLNDPQTKVPFPVLLDIELKAVDRLGIRQTLSKPATFILDKQGRTRYAYVGNSLGDRPSIKAILKELDALKQPS
jgi:peroxiredoxin